ncbi:MAG: PEP-CTERM sorting domain-containing protein, partial [Betaproteobacteria bacterium]|nr:PEP-CTERM sorting domain-containing protein [Betaproteobacteria bacterium]
VLSGGTFTGGGASAGAVMNGSVTWTGGSFAGTWQVASGQTLVAGDGTSKTFVGTTFVNRGAMIWQSTARVGFSSSNVTNAGLFEVQTDADLLYTSGNPSTFSNIGTFRKSGGSGVTEVGNYVAFTNDGVVDVMVGTLQLPGNFVNAGTITGGGVVQNALLTNNGHVAPGNGVGELTLAGSFVQGTTGALDIQLGPLGSHDRFVVSGTTSLDGALELSCAGDCLFTAGDTIAILDSGGALTGTFSGGVTLSGFRTGSFDVVYDIPLGQVRLMVLENVTAVPEPGTWALVLAGLGVTVLVVARRTNC